VQTGRVQLDMENRWLALVNQSSEYEVDIFRSFFDLYDRDASGTIDQEELLCLLEDMEMLPKTEKMKEELLKIQVSYSCSDLNDCELPGLLAVLTAWNRLRYMEIWKVHHKPDDVISKAEMKQLLRKFDEVKAYKDNELDEWCVEFGCGEDQFNFDGLCYILLIFRERKLSTYMAKAGFTNAEIEEWQSVFEKYDTDKSGEISNKELYVMLADMGKTPRTKAEQERFHILKQRIDADDSGLIEFEEFLMLMRVWSNENKRTAQQFEKQIGALYNFTEPQVHEFREIFYGFDDDGSGTVDMQELGSLFRQLSVTLSQPEYEEVKKIMMEVRKDHGCEFTATTAKHGDVLDVTFAQFLEVIGRVLKADIGGMKAKIAHKADAVQGRAKVQQHKDMK